jgi:hypothetical protein
MNQSEVSSLALFLTEACPFSGRTFNVVGKNKSSLGGDTILSWFEYMKAHKKEAELFPNWVISFCALSLMIDADNFGDIAITTASSMFGDKVHVEVLRLLIPSAYSGNIEDQNMLKQLAKAIIQKFSISQFLSVFCLSLSSTIRPKSAQLSYLRAILDLGKPLPDDIKLIHVTLDSLRNSSTIGSLEPGIRAIRERLNQPFPDVRDYNRGSSFAGSHPTARRSV